MRVIVTWLVVLGVVRLVLTAAAHGLLTAEQAAWILVGTVVLATFGKKLVPILTVVVGLVLLAWEYSHGDRKTFEAILWQLVHLAILLLGLTMMLQGLLPSKSKRIADEE